MAMTFFRWCFAIVILAPFAWRHVVSDWPRIRANWRILLFLGAIGVGTHNGLAYLGLAYTTATNGVILNSFIPVMIVLISWIFLRERLTPLQISGVAVSLAGVFTILSDGSLATLARVPTQRRRSAGHPVDGDVVRVHDRAALSSRRPERDVVPAGAGRDRRPVRPAVLAGRACDGHRPQWSWEFFAAMVAVALFSSVLAYLFWNRGVAEVGANVAGLFVHLMPVFGVVLAWLFLDERMAPFHVAGIALILSGIWITSRYQRRRADVDEAAAVGTD